MFRRVMSRADETSADRCKHVGNGNARMMETPKHKSTNATGNSGNDKMQEVKNRNDNKNIYMQKENDAITKYRK